MSKVAIIDLGTNTFHLMVAELSANRSYQTLFKERRFVKLADAGIEVIGVEPFNRGIEAMHYFKSLIAKHQIEKVKAIGTAALRTAKNGPDFVNQVYQETGITIELITGEREAELIYEGIKQVIPETREKFLVMDIGGGSVEFILADQHQIYWAESFPIGVAVLYKGFHYGDPITESEILALEGFLNKTLSSLREVLDEHEVPIIVGASGTFDVMAELENSIKTEHFAEMNVAHFLPFYNYVVPMTVADRRAANEIPNDRSDMIVVALILIKAILELNDFQKIWISDYAMKEGIIAEILSV